jgi:hypothetical protein
LWNRGQKDNSSEGRQRIIILVDIIREFKWALHKTYVCLSLFDNTVKCNPP